MRTVKGRIVFTKMVDGKPKPINNMRVELWDLDVIANDFLASGRTDYDGKFNIKYDPAKAGPSWLDTPDLVLRLVDKNYSYDKKGKPVETNVVVASWDAGEVTEDVHDFGMLDAAYWEYEDREDISKIAFTPRVAVVDGHVPQDQRPGRKMEQVAVGARNLGEHAKHLLMNKFNQHLPTPERLNKDFPKNLTQKMGHERSRSDEYLCDLVLNGFNPQILKTSGKDKYYVEFRYDGLHLDGEHFAPNTRANFKLVKGELKLLSIEVQKRVGGEPSAHARLRAPKTFTPPKKNDTSKEGKEQAKEWDRVKWMFRVNYFIFGELDTHLAATHLNVEQYIVPLRRNVHLNPVARLLYPHFYGTVAVNLAANGLLIDPTEGLVAACSAFTPESVTAAAAAAFGGYNWYGWKPRKALCKSHRFAKLSGLYWRLVGDYVDEFFKKNLAGIKRYWKEIHRFSDELVDHALPYVPQDDDSWYDTGEINTSRKTRAKVDGREVALTRITNSDKPSAAGINNLKQLCRYLLFITTFKHSWVNDSQYDIGGEVLFATLGVMNDVTNLSFSDEELVEPSQALQHPFITYVLAYTKYGYIVRNEDDDMNPALIKRLVEAKDKFNKLGLDVREIRSCINT